MNRRKLSIIGCFIVASLVLGSGNGKAEVETLKIGNLHALTGTGASWGLPCTRVSQTLCDIVNDKGGITVGGKTYRLELISEDDQYTAAGGRAAIEKLIFRDNVKYVIGFSSASALAIMPIIHKNKIIFIPHCSTPRVFDMRSPYLFKSFVPSSQVERNIPLFIAQNLPKVKRIAAFYANDATGKDTLAGLKLGIEDVNKTQPGRVELVAEDSFERSSTDFTPQLTRLLRSKPDAISDCASCSPATAPMLVKQARDLGYKGYFISASTGGWVLDRLVKVAGPDYCYNMWVNTLDFENIPEVTVPEKYAKMYAEYEKMWGNLRSLAAETEKRYGSPEGAIQFESIPMIVRGILAADSIDTDKVVKAMEAWEAFPTYFGIGFWDGKETFGIKHSVCQPYPMTQIEGGKVVKTLFFAPKPLP